MGAIEGEAPERKMVAIETAGVANPADTQGEKAASGGRTGAIETADVADPAEYGGGEAGFRAKTAGRAGAEVAHPAKRLRERGIPGVGRAGAIDITGVADPTDNKDPAVAALGEKMGSGETAEDGGPADKKVWEAAPARSPVGAPPPRFSLKRRGGCDRNHRRRPPGGVRRRWRGD